MPQASFHYCFNSKRELLESMVRQTVQALRERVEQMSPGPTGATMPGEHEDIGELFTATLEALFEEASSRPERELAFYELTATALRDDQLVDLARVQYDAYFSAMQDLLRNIRERAQITWTVPEAIVVRMAVACVDGLILGWLTDRDDDSVRLAIRTFGAQLAGLARPI